MAASAPGRIQVQAPPLSAGERMLRLRSEQIAAYLAKHPVPNLLMTLSRNKNQNFVCYQAQLHRDRMHFQAKDPVAVFWLDIEPSYQAAARRKGRSSDRCELNFIERSQAYGVTTTPRGSHHAGRPTEFALALVAFRQRPFTLRVVDGVPRLIGKIAGERAVLQRVHVQAHDRFLMLPAVECVFLVGHSVVTGRLLQETIKP